MNTERHRLHVPAVSAADGLMRMNISGHPSLESELSLVRVDGNHRRSEQPKMILDAHIKHWVKLTGNRDLQFTMVK